jgi:hypothetical protein
MAQCILGNQEKAPGKSRDLVKGDQQPTLFLNPQILDEILKYVYLPKDVIKGYKLHSKP